MRVSISSFIVGSIKQTKHAVGMQQGGARSRTQCPGGDGDGRRVALDTTRARGQTGTQTEGTGTPHSEV